MAITPTVAMAAVPSTAHASPMTTSSCEEIESDDGQQNPDPITLEKLPHGTSSFLRSTSAKTTLEEE